MYVFVTCITCVFVLKKSKEIDYVLRSRTNQANTLGVQVPLYALSVETFNPFLKTYTKKHVHLLACIFWSSFLRHCYLFIYALCSQVALPVQLAVGSGAYNGIFETYTKHPKVSSTL